MIHIETINLRRLPHGRDMPLPAYATPGAAGFDLQAAIPADKPVTLHSGARSLIPTGFAFEIPSGYEMQVRPRSGLAAKHGIFVVNSPGTVDSDFRGEVQVILYNSGDEPFTIHRGDRIAQAVVAPAVQMALVLTDELSQTKRADGGFGSTGVAMQPGVVVSMSSGHMEHAAAQALASQRYHQEKIAILRQGLVEARTALLSAERHLFLRYERASAGSDATADLDAAVATGTAAQRISEVLK